jgi:hypothetical protein
MFETKKMNIIHAIDTKIGQNLCKTLTKPKITITKPPQIFKSKP